MHQPGAPLIPPNQSLKVALSSPSATRNSAGEVGSSSASLATNKKMVWYTAEVQKSDEFPLPAGQKQVILEQGIGFAYRFSDSKLPPGITQSDVGSFFHFFYQAIRYFDGDLPGMSLLDEQGQQIPSGTYTEGGNHVSMELL